MNRRTECRVRRVRGGLGCERQADKGGGSSAVLVRFVSSPRSRRYLHTSATLTAAIKDGDESLIATGGVPLGRARDGPDEVEVILLVAAEILRRTVREDVFAVAVLVRTPGADRFDWLLLSILLLPEMSKPSSPFLLASFPLTSFKFPLIRNPSAVLLFALLLLIKLLLPPTWIPVVLAAAISPAMEPLTSLKLPVIWSPTPLLLARIPFNMAPLALAVPLFSARIPAVPPITSMPLMMICPAPA